MSGGQMVSPRARRVEGVLPAERVLGSVLAVVGAVLLAGFVIHDLQRWSMLLVSATTLIAFLLTREYGFGVAAGITGGIGTGIAIITGALVIGGITPATAPGWLLLSSGAGFVAAWILGWFASPIERHPWPLVPGFLIGSIGAAIAAGQPSWIEWIQVAVALLLVTGGVVAIFRRGQERTAAG